MIINSISCRTTKTDYGQWDDLIIDEIPLYHYYEECIEDEIVPVLVCPDDPELDCLVLVAYIRKDTDFIYWDRIGRVILPNRDEASKEWLLSGYKCKDLFSEEKCQVFGPETPVDIMEDEEADDWIYSHGREEFCRRYTNFFRKYYRQPNSIKWLSDVNWRFERKQYENCISYLKNTYDIDKTDENRED